MKTILPFVLLLVMLLVSCEAPERNKAWETSAAQKSPAVAPPKPAAAPAAEAAEAPSVASTNAIAAPQSEATPAATNVEANVEAPELAAAKTNAPSVTNAVPTIRPGRGPAARAAAFRATNAPPEETLAPGMINFQATDLNQVLQIYAELVNRTILRPANLGAPQITLKTQTTLTKKEAIQALDAVFAMNGIAIINVGDKFAKAVPAAQANQEGQVRDTREVQEIPELGQIMTRVTQLKYVKPSEMMAVLTPFAKSPNAILPIEGSGILVLRDYTENIKRMLEMIDQVDVTVPSEFTSEVIPIKYAKASEIASALNSLSGSGGGGVSFGARSSGGATRGAPSAGGMSRPGMGGMGGMGGTGGAAYGAQGNTAATGAPGAAGGSFTDRMRQIINKAATSSSGEMQIIGQNKIIADERSNSLLVFASRQDMDTITNIISKLDVVLAQVLIETIIMDVSLSDTKALGFSAIQTGQNFKGDTTAGAGGMNASQFFNGFNTTGSDSNAVSQLLGTGLRYFAKVDDKYYLSVQAAAAAGKVNVIQTPRILTTHATPGSIFVGNTVPYVTSSYYGGGYGGGPSSSYQQLQVGIGLQVTPYINQDGLVVMQIDETIDEISGSTDITGVGAVPNTTSRKLSAEVAVRNGDSVILGGFMRNSTTKNNSGIPLLKDIPLLGALFSSRSSAKERKELLVVMRPTVLKTPEIAAEETGLLKQKMPGIRQAEAEGKQEEKDLDKAEKKEAARREAIQKRGRDQSD